MPEPLVKLRKVSKSFSSRAGLRQVLEDVDLEIASGERISLVGPNGSGKTTLLRIILGIDEPDTGAVSHHWPNNARNISYVPQDYRNALFPWLRLSSNLALANGGGRSRFPSSQSSGVASDASKEYEVLAQAFRLPLDLTKYPYQLSGGEQQIFLLLRAIVSRPSLILLDEPLSAVDFGRRRLILEHLGKWIPDTKATLVFASHDFEESVMLADRVIVMARRSGQVKATIRIDLPWPRNLEMRSDPLFRSVVDQITKAVI
jgi:NitT/TauT family transport system ATP-binding protein